MKINNRNSISRRPHAVEILLRLKSHTIRRSSSNYVMRDAIMKRIPPGTLIAKEILGDPDCLKLVVFKEIKNFFMRMENFVPGIYEQWEDKERITIVVHECHDFAGIQRSLMNPVVIASRHQLITGAQNWLNHLNSVNMDIDTNENISELEMSVLQIANYVFDDENIKTFLYGSRLTGLAREDADVDFFLDINDSFRGSHCYDVDYQRDVISRLALAMRARPKDFAKVFALVNTAVPVLRFKHLRTNLNGEVACRSGISVRNSELVKLYLDLDERVKFVLCGVKYWFAQNKLNDRVFFPPTAQTWFALFFLMQPHIALIPSVHELRQMLPLHLRKDCIENWNCSFAGIDLARMMWTSPCYLTGEELLEEFFNFYSNIPVERHVLCTFDGSIRLRKQFFKCYQLLKLNRELHSRVQEDFSGFCLQDPFDRFKNLTKNHKRTNLRKFVEFVELAQESHSLMKEGKYLSYF